jgi:hypothetical protein
MTCHHPARKEEILDIRNDYNAFKQPINTKLFWCPQCQAVRERTSASHSEFGVSYQEAGGV